MNFNLEDLLNGKRLAISRALSIVENSAVIPEALNKAIYGHIGHAHRVGITGSPGAGKSSLLDALISIWRQEEKTVGIISIDPTSPFTGGAILGDRIRMLRHHKDKGVFIRSMATRGNLGGLADKAQESADIMDIAGFDIIVFETVGVGQVELDVAKAADTTIVVLVPENGDDIQAMKAGLTEIADIFTINKADRDGSNQAFVQVQNMIEMRLHGSENWIPTISKTSTLTNEGIEDLYRNINMHYQYLKSSKTLEKNRLNRISSKIQSLLNTLILDEFWTALRKQYLDQYLSNFDNTLTSNEIIKVLKEIDKPQ